MAGSQPALTPPLPPLARSPRYIHATRFDWRTSKALGTESERQHKRWLECWQCMELADLHHFPLWEKGVFDCLHECFDELIQIFAHYAKSVSDTTVEDAMEITLSEFKKLVKDVGEMDAGLTMARRHAQPSTYIISRPFLLIHRSRDEGLQVRCHAEHVQESELAQQ